MQNRARLTDIDDLEVCRRHTVEDSECNRR